MQLIKKIKNEGTLNSLQLVQLFTEIANNGHVLIVKSDGQREKAQFTSVISFPEAPLDAIRVEGNDLLECVFECISQYSF